MNDYDIPQELFDETMDGVHELSADWRHSVPKRGMEEEWNRRKERAECLERMIDLYVTSVPR